MHVAFNGCQNNFSGKMRLFVSAFFFDKRRKIPDGFFHNPGAFYHLRQKHLSRTEKFTDRVHPGHKRTLDNLQRMRVFFTGLFDIDFDKFIQPFDQGMTQPFLHRCLAPLRVVLLSLTGALELFGKGNQLFGSLRVFIQKHILDKLQQILGNLFVNGDHAGVDNTHIHPGGDRVIQKHRMHGLADAIVAAKRKRHIAHPAAHQSVRKFFLQYPGRLNKIPGVIIVLLDPGGHGKNVGIKNNVALRKSFRGQNFVRPAQYFDFAVQRICLALFVKSHHHDSRTVSPDQPGLLSEFRFAFFQGNGIDYRLSLQTFKRGFDHRPFRGIHHNRHPGDIRFGRHQIQKFDHGLLRIDHGLIHIHVDNLRTGLHLLTGDSQSLGIFFRADQVREFF